MAESPDKLVPRLGWDPENKDAEEDIDGKLVSDCCLSDVVPVVELLSLSDVTTLAMDQIFGLFSLDGTV